GADSHYRYPHPGNPEPMGRRASSLCGDAWRQRGDVSPDHCCVGVASESTHGHSPQGSVVEGAAAREPQRSPNASTAMSPKAVTEPNRNQSPLCPCKAPPEILPSQVPAASPGDGSRVFVALAGDWFKCGGKDRHAPAPG